MLADKFLTIVDIIYPFINSNKFVTGKVNIIAILGKNSTATIQFLADEINISKRNVEKNLKQLKEKGLLARIGSDKSGRWKIIK